MEAHRHAEFASEEAMNCRNCNTRINYNYLTNCPQCGCAVERGDLPKLDPSTTPVKKIRVWLYGLANLVYVLITAMVGLISGAVVMYFSAAVVYIALSTPDTYPGESCARGAAIGMLSILCGGFLGTIGGAVFAVKRPILKTRREA